MAAPLTHRTRIEAALSGGRLDRPPVSLWRHFPVDDQTSGGLAAATLAFQRTFDWDLVKVTPASSYGLRGWGSQDEWRGNPEGTRTYTHFPIQRPEDWTRLQPLDPRQGMTAQVLEAVAAITLELGRDTPVLQTIFSPLSQAKNLVGRDRLVAHLRHYPEEVHAGLQIITETTRRLVEAALQTGIAGVFYAIQHANYGLLSPEEYADFGRPYDLQVLEPASGLWLNMVHLHGPEVIFDAIRGYPVQILNWHDRETRPSLAEGQQLFPGIVCGGLRREETLLLGTPEQVRAEAREAIQETGGQRFLLGTGCVTYAHTPYGNLVAARRSVEA
jgi:uroporphyrinogen decarboxylase